MNERDRVVEEAKNIIIESLRETLRKKSNRYEITEMVNKILDIPELCIKSDDQSLPELRGECRGQHGIYDVPGDDMEKMWHYGKFAQQDMLKDNWVRVAK
jgi:hypothetical protein